MRKLILSLAFILIAILYFTACSKDNNNNSTGSDNPQFVADIDGKTFIGTNMYAEYLEKDILGIRVTMGKAGFEIILINPAVNKFVTDSSNGLDIHNIMVYGTDTTASSYYISDGDYIYVTAFDKVNNKISGTFSFNGLPKGGASGTVKIRSGVFSNIPIKPVSTIFATVNGSDFITDNVYADNYNGKINLMSAFGPKHNTYPQLNVTFPTNAAPGVHPANSSSFDYLIEYAANDTSFYSSANSTANGGSITILKNNIAAKTITGKFSGTIGQFLYPKTVAITGGTFTAIYK